MKGTKALYPVLAAVLVLGLCAMVSCQGMGEKRSDRLSVKTSLWEAPYDMQPEGADPVGAAIFHTNDEGELVTNVQLDAGAENERFNVLLDAHPEKDDTLEHKRIGCVNTDGQGKGEVIFKSDAPDHKAAAEIYVQVLLEGKNVSYATKEVRVPLKR